MRDIKPMILFVDDEELARRTFKRIADKEFRVLLAESVDEAIQVLEEHSEDIGVLLSDQRMPGRLGVDLLEHCRRKYPKIVRMLTTAYSELNDAIAAVNRGEIMRYIEKPWGNIDGLLIDLRVAMSLFEMRAENEQLVAEKLSVGYMTSRIDKIKTLIAMAACQPHNNKMLAVESLLRQVSEVDAYRVSPDSHELLSFQVFGQPLADSVASIEIGSHLLKHRSDIDGQVAPEVLSDIGSVVGSENVEISFDQSMVDSDYAVPLLSKILAASKSAFGLEGKLICEATTYNDGLALLATAEGGGSATVRSWITGKVAEPEKLHTQIGALLEVFLLSYHIDGRVQMNIDAEGLLQGISFHFQSGENPFNRSTPTNEYDWIDDILILFS